MPLISPVERLLSNPEVADEGGDGDTHLRLLEHRHNLLDTESFSFHGILLSHPGVKYAGNSSSNRCHNRVADQVDTDITRANSVHTRSHGV